MEYLRTRNEMILKVSGYFRNECAWCADLVIITLQTVIPTDAVLSNGVVNYSSDVPAIKPARNPE
jgi:hypothetical protein